MDTFYYLVQSTLPIAIPLLLVALGGMFSERSGIINIALEGIMIFGAFFGAIFVLSTQNSSINPQILLIIGALVAGFASIGYSMLLAYASVNLKANQVIVGTALNMLIPAIVIIYAQLMNAGWSGVGDSPYSGGGITTTLNLYIHEVPLLSQIPVIGDLLFKDTYLTVYLGFLVLIISTIVLYKTKFGLRLRACGEHPQAADSVGINVYKMRYAGVALSGFLGGMGGYFYSVSVLNSNISGLTGVAGYGFLALAVMIFGQWKPVRIFFAALFFAFLSTLSVSVPLIPFLNNLGLDLTIYKMLPYIATLIVLIFTSKSSKAPKAEGIPYDKGLR